MNKTPVRPRFCLCLCTQPHTHASSECEGYKLSDLPHLLRQILDTVRGRLDRGEVSVTVLDPVSTEGMTLDKDLDALTDDVRQRMLKVFQQDS